MEKLTPKQNAVLVSLKKFMAKKGYPPTVREICADTNLSSTATVQTHLETLVAKGYIKKDQEKNRTIELLVPNEFEEKDDKIISVPLLGKVTAGNPIEAIEMPDEYFDIPSYFSNGRKELFTLKVSGESMINAGIFDGDIIVVERCKTANNSEIVVAMTDENTVTVKRFFKEKDHFRLQPENDTMDPIILDNITILGKVIGLYRKF